jgi:hypothetical protein
MQKLDRGQLPTKQDLKSIKGKEQDEVVMALTQAIGPDEAIKLLEMCDMSKHAEKLVSAKGNPDGPLPKYGEPPVDAMKKTPGQKKKKIKEEVKTIKVGEDAVGSDNCHYALVMDRKVTAVGTKDQMLAKCKEEGGRVWVSTKKVGDIVEEAELRHLLRLIPETAEYHVTRPGGSLKKPDSVHKSKTDAMKAAYRLSKNKHMGAKGGQVYRVHKGEVTHGFDTEGRSRHLGLDHGKVTGKKPIKEMGQMSHGNPLHTSNAGKSRSATSKPMAAAGKKRKTLNKLEKKMSALKMKKRTFRRDMYEAKYAIDIEGMPRFYMDSDSPGRVKVALRQMLKKANAIKSVTRTYDPAIKADLRSRLKDASTDMQTNYVNEKLKPSDDMGDWVDDFKKSDAPQFKGKSMKKRRQMAIAAKLSAMEETGSWKSDSGWKKVSGPRKDDYGNTVKKQNIAKHLAKKAMNKTKAMGEKK